MSVSESLYQRMMPGTRDNWLNAREAHEQATQMASTRGVTPMAEKSPSGALRRSLDADALSEALRKSTSKVDGVLDALDKADQREAQLSKADGEGRRARAERFPEMAKGGRL